MKIRTYQEKDKEEIKKLITNILEELWNKKPTNIEDLENIPQNYHVFYVAKDKGIIGTCGLLKMRGETAQLKRMYIHKDYRHKGIGTKLIKKIIDFAKNNKFKRIILSTYENNPNAISFYKKHNFIEFKRENEKIWFELK